MWWHCQFPPQTVLLVWWAGKEDQVHCSSVCWLRHEFSAETSDRWGRLSNKIWYVYFWTGAFCGSLQMLWSESCHSAYALIPDSFLICLLDFLKFCLWFGLLVWVFFLREILNLVRSYSKKDLHCWHMNWGGRLTVLSFWLMFHHQYVSSSIVRSSSLYSERTKIWKLSACMCSVQPVACKI